MGHKLDFSFVYLNGLFFSNSLKPFNLLAVMKNYLDLNFDAKKLKFTYALSDLIRVNDLNFFTENWRKFTLL